VIFLALALGFDRLPEVVVETGDLHGLVEHGGSCWGSFGR
jgi:hypothetical protein